MKYNIGFYMFILNNNNMPNQEIYLTDEVYDMVKDLKRKKINISKIIQTSISNEYERINNPKVDLDKLLELEILDTREQKLKWLYEHSAQNEKSQQMAHKLFDNLDDTELDKIILRTKKEDIEG